MSVSNVGKCWSEKSESIAKVKCRWQVPESNVEIKRVECRSLILESDVGFEYRTCILNSNVGVE